MKYQRQWQLFSSSEIYTDFKFSIFTSSCIWGLTFDTSNLCYLGVSNKLLFGIACDVESKFQACCASSLRVRGFCYSLSELYYAVFPYKTFKYLTALFNPICNKFLFFRMNSFNKIYRTIGAKSCGDDSFGYFRRFFSKDYSSLNNCNGFIIGTSILSLLANSVFNSCCKKAESAKPPTRSMLCTFDSCGFFIKVVCSTAVHHRTLSFI